MLRNKCRSLVEDNYLKVKKELSRELEGWQSTQLSWLGKIATIKMMVLPKLIFLFQTIPILMKPFFFSEQNKLVSKFVWAGKKPRVKLKNMQHVKERTGLGVPNWQLYYQAAALTWIREWVIELDQRLLALEGFDLLLGWHGYIWYDKDKTHSFFMNHAIRKALNMVWRKVRDKTYTKTPLWVFPKKEFLHPALIRGRKKITYSDLLNDRGNLKMVMELQEQGISVDWWTRVQLTFRHS